MLILSHLQLTHIDQDGQSWKMELKELNIKNSLQVTITFKYRYSYYFVHLIEITWHLDFSSTNSFLEFTIKVMLALSPYKSHP